MLVAPPPKSHPGFCTTYGVRYDIWVKGRKEAEQSAILEFKLSGLKGGILAGREGTHKSIQVELPRWERILYKG